MGWFYGCAVLQSVSAGYNDLAWPKPKNLKPLLPSGLMAFRSRINPNSKASWFMSGQLLRPSARWTWGHCLVTNISGIFAKRSGLGWSGTRGWRSRPKRCAIILLLDLLGVRRAARRRFLPSMPSHGGCAIHHEARSSLHPPPGK